MILSLLKEDCFTYFRNISLSITLKNFADIRNTKVKNIIERLDLYGTKITVVDPYG